MTSSTSPSDFIESAAAAIADAEPRIVANVVQIIKHGNIGAPLDPFNVMRGLAQQNANRIIRAVPELGRLNPNSDGTNVVIQAALCAAALENPSFDAEQSERLLAYLEVVMPQAAATLVRFDLATAPSARVTGTHRAAAAPGGLI